MASNAVLANGVQPAVTTVVLLYTAPAAGAGTRITAFTAANPSATHAKFDAHIVPSGDSASDVNLVIKDQGLAAAESMLSTVLQNHLIPAGGTLQVKVSNATTITFRATGVEF
jgi:hypothetical protein